MPAIRLELDGPIATLTLANPAQRNALTPGMIDDLARHVDALESFDGVGLILTGEGTRCFSAGADLAFVRQHIGDRQAGEEMARRMHELTSRVQALPLVSVCAIEGGAYGGGAELTTCTDFRVASESAKIQFVHARLGLVPGWGGAVRLTRLLGRQRSLRVLAFSPKLTAAEALDLGLVDSLCAPGQAAEAAAALLEPLTSLPRASVRAAKRVVHDADALPEREALNRAVPRFGDLWTGPDIRRTLDS